MIIPVINATNIKGSQSEVGGEEALQLLAGNLELIVTKVLNLGHRGKPFIRSFISYLGRQAFLTDVSTGASPACTGEVLN